MGCYKFLQNPYCFHRLLWIGFLCNSNRLLWTPVAPKQIPMSHCGFLWIPVELVRIIIEFNQLSQLSAKSVGFLWIPVDSYRIHMDPYRIPVDSYGCLQNSDG